LIADFLVFVVGIAALYFGAEWLVGGAARLAAALGVSSFVVGLTLVSLGTSAPELVVSGLASHRGSGGLAIGNVLGSNVANIALILGVAALIFPIRVREELIARDVPIMIATAALIPVLAWSGVISRVEGGFLLILFALYIGYVGMSAYRESASVLALLDERGHPRASRKAAIRDLAAAGGGLVVLSAGAHFLVVSATGLAGALGVPDVVIGLSLVAFGTSLPELAASVSAARRGESQIVIGNILGSNIFNVLLILGAAAVIRPIPVASSVARIDAMIVVGLSAALVPVIFSNRSITRWEGGALFAAYLAFIGWLVI
jgi:cation:H+ antiporter